MNIHTRLLQLLAERGWTQYRLSKECGLSESTLANIFKRGTMPSLSTLEAICNGFDISLSQFFAEGNTVEMTPELQALFREWISLTAEQKIAILQLMRTMKHS